MLLWWLRYYGNRLALLLAMFYWYFSSGLAKITQKPHHLHVHPNALTMDIFSFPKESSVRTKLIVPLNTKRRRKFFGGVKKIKLKISSYIKIIGLVATYQRKSRFHLSCYCKLPFYATPSLTLWIPTFTSWHIENREGCPLQVGQ